MPHGMSPITPFTQIYNRCPTVCLQSNPSLRSITITPRYVANQTLHSDLHIPHVHTVFRERRATYRTALDSHPNPLMEPLAHPPNNRRLKRRWTFDEIHLRSVAGRLLDHRQWGSALAHRKRCSDVF